jgi:nucleoid-associated protein YgaU
MTPPADDAAPEKYTVKPGDTFAVLAELYYGSQRYADALMKANPHVSSPTALRPGMVLTIPAKPQLASAKATPGTSPAVATVRPAPGQAQPQAAADGTRLYTVKPNDTFYGIAASQLGSQARWKELFELNKDRVGGDPKGLRPGMTLRLPPPAPLQVPKATSASAPAADAASKPTSLTATRSAE